MSYTMLLILSGWHVQLTPHTHPHFYLCFHDSFISSNLSALRDYTFIQVTDAVYLAET